MNQYVAGADFATPAAYRIFRYQSLSTVNPGDGHQLSELEFFGNEVPEPASLSLFALGAMALAARRRNQRA